MAMDYTIGKSDFERVRKAAQTLLDVDGGMVDFDGGEVWQIDASQTLAIGCGMLAALEALLSDKEAGVITANATRTFVELADIRARLEAHG